MKLLKLAATALAVFAVLGISAAAHAQDKLLNVSYDPTRELYKAYNAGFEASWKHKTGKAIEVQQSHGGSGKQARAVLDGLGADVVTLGIPSDIDALAKAGLVRHDWPTVFPNHSVPYTSTIAFVVRKGNPKGIKDWGDLIKPGVNVVTPSPKSSSGGRWNYLAAWGWAELTQGGKASARNYVAKLYANAPILDSGARGSTVTFVDRGQGDVLIAWENEALLITKSLGAGKYEIVRPSLTIRAEPPIAVVDKNVDEHGTRQIAINYLSGLYTPEGQKIAAENFYRPLYTKGVPKAELAVFPKVKEFTFEKVFGSWDATQKAHFDDGGVFDQIYAKH
ncbi:MAG: sulfate ABC transporter substrate-binding protein [Capsulimonadaceae bacterium]|nr:sulfate ABC transporter substrate-binding protein [Capsulimonadaceae bacterium]